MIYRKINSFPWHNVFYLYDLYENIKLYVFLLNFLLNFIILLNCTIIFILFI